MTVRVLIADDSEAMRSTLAKLLAGDPRIAVIGSARDGVEAVALAKALRPDVITMDIVMPNLDGVSAIEHIMADSPARILIVSSYADAQVDLAFRAMAAGALEVLAKPASAGPDALRAWAARVCEAIVLMSEVPVITRRQRAPDRRADALGIAASTGGPLALSQLLGALPGDLPIPIFVAQHITEGFTAGLVRWLATATELTVAIAGEGDAPRPGHVYLAPDRRDLEVGAGGAIRTPPASDRHTPSADRLLTSLARHHGARAAGAVLTGMGDDGAAGLLAIRRAGGATFAQTREDCVVFGMPQAALARGATSELRSIEALAREVVVVSAYGRSKNGR